jgi:predicted amidophosphoribosyltransferase
MGKHNKVVYEYLKSHNLCVSCGRKTNWDKVRCASCSERYNRNARLKARQIRIQKSYIYCSKCGKNVVKSNGLCDECYGEVVIPEYLRR